MHAIPYVCPGCGVAGETATECDNAVALHVVHTCGAGVRLELQAVAGVGLADGVLAMRARGASWSQAAAEHGITYQRAVGIGGRATAAAGA